MKDELKQQYHRKFSHVSPVPWNQHFIVELENIYTSVKVISVPKGQRGSVHIPDILRYCSLADKCIIIILHFLTKLTFRMMTMKTTNNKDLLTINQLTTV